MKVRNGFVSNSSSSSFIVCKALVGDDAFLKIIDTLADIERKHGSDSEVGCYYTHDKNYIFAEISYHVDFTEILEKLSIPNDSYFFGQ